MLEFIEFDCQRLIQFKKNPLTKNLIDIYSLNNARVLIFEPVAYFNYAFLKSNAPLELHAINQLIRRHNLPKYKFIVDSDEIEMNAFFSENLSYTCDYVISYFKSPKVDIILDHEEGIQLIAVDNANIQKYKEVYLNVFDAENLHPASVEENLRLILEIPGFKAFLVEYEGRIAGACSFWIYQGTLMFTFGGLLPEFKGKGLHRKMLYERFRIANKLGQFESVSSWTKQNSSSSYNLRSFGLVNLKNYHVYEFTPTPG